MTSPQSTGDVADRPTAQPVAAVRNLRVETSDGLCIVDDVSFDLHAGEILGVVGESGSGKTTSVLSFFGFAQHGARFVDGTVTVPGRDPIDLATATNMRDLRGRYFSYVPQNPGTALNPTMRIAKLLREVGDRRAAVDPVFRERRDVVTSEALDIVGLPTTPEFRKRYPHQLSGGQQQRVCIAMALLSGSKAIVLDEPTTGLDVITQAAVIRELQRLRSEIGVSMVYISHDLAVVSQLATRVAVMYAGQVVEVGATEDVLRRPSHPYTRGLLESRPDIHRPRTFGSPAEDDGRPGRTPASEPTDAVLDVRGLNITHRVRGVEAASVRDISFALKRGECLALVGQSGSGKTTIARAVAGIQKVDTGEFVLGGRQLPSDSAARTVEQRRDLQIVFQNATQALNPRETVHTAIERVLRQTKKADPSVTTTTAELLEMVRIRESCAHRLPRELSGGERQRVCIARALAASPKVIVCDEITSALDVTVQAAVLELLNDLRRKLGVALLFITHDLGVVAGIADTVMILESGRVRESGVARTVLDSPTSDYGRRLIEAVPTLC
ncbi:ABC transporter ATP-binding protein [Rhodococcus sp. NPDC056960]|uniref:ABC transporter ATP-binding protein n=1 Tax=Rhodococcus sp. NPDC056960 TaxID=3345982 RepID=UPI0036455A8A